MRRNLVFALITTALLSAAVALELRGRRPGGDEGVDSTPQTTQEHPSPQAGPTPQEAPPSQPEVALPQPAAERDPMPPGVGRLPSVEGTPDEVPHLVDPASRMNDADDLKPNASSPESPALPVKDAGSVVAASDDPVGPILNDTEAEAPAGNEYSAGIQRLPPIEEPGDEPMVRHAPTAAPAPQQNSRAGEHIARPAAPPVAPSDHWQALTDHALNDYEGPRYSTSAEAIPPALPQGAPAPQRAAAWWSDLIPKAQREGSRPQPLDLATLVQETILHSQHVQAISLEPRIRETEITQADAAFDPSAFIESKWNDLSEPVGNLLTTGGPPRLSREEWTSDVGFRRKMRAGGRVEVAQRLTEEDNNSVFFVPANQATSRMTLSLEQPLLKGGGKAYNRSLIILAQHDTQIAQDTFQSELQTQVARVVRAYWDLYYQRAVMLQQRAAMQQAEGIRADLEARQSFDSLASQVSRVTATVSIRKAGVLRAWAGVRNAETRLRTLTTSPLLGGASEPIELLPIEPPLEEEVELEPEAARQLALANRTEIDAALNEVRAAGVRLGVADNEMLPSLGLVLETYLSGLEGNFDLAGSFGEQFSQGAPSYTVGVLFEIPLGRRAAGAVRQRRVLELRQSEADLRQTTANLSAEVDIALREVKTTWQEFLARRDAAVATASEVRQKRARLNLIPGEDHASVSIHLDDLLNAIDRLVSDETALAEAQRNYAVSIAEFHRATGMLLNVETTSPPQVHP